MALEWKKLRQKNREERGKVFGLTDVVHRSWLHGCQKEDKSKLPIDREHGSKAQNVSKGSGCSFLTCHPAPVQKPLLPLQHKGEGCQTHGQVKGDAAGVRGGEDWWHCFEKVSRILWQTNHWPEHSSRRDEGGEVRVEAAVDGLLKLQQKGYSWLLIMWHPQIHNSSNVAQTEVCLISCTSITPRMAQKLNIAIKNC